MLSVTILFVVVVYCGLFCNVILALRSIESMHSIVEYDILFADVLELCVPVDTDTCSPIVWLTESVAKLYSAL